MNNSDMSKLLSMLSKMDKNELQNGINQASKILNSEDKAKLENILKNMNR